MAEEQNSNPQDPQAQPQRPRMQVLSQYIRDLSFENVAIQKGDKVEGQPEVQVQVGLDAKKKSDDVYEIITKFKVESKTPSQTVFILELEYAGQFRVENVPENQLHPYLMIECPRMIFPYVRRIIGDVTRDGGFPPLNVDNIDFLALYQQDLMRRQAAQQQAGGGNGSAPTQA